MSPHDAAHGAARPAADPADRHADRHAEHHVHQVSSAHAFDVVAAGEGHYVEHLRTPDLSVGTYALPEGGQDSQSGHTEDEVYVVVSGAAVLSTPEGDVPATPGTVIVVRAGVRHQFVHIQRDFRVVVVFAPPERTRAGQT